MSAKTKISENLDIEIADEYPYRDRELMETLYVEEELSQNEISAILDCSSGSVANWLERHGIESRSLSDAISLSYEEPYDIPFWTHNTKGHVFAKSGDDLLTVHRLQAVAYWGFDDVADKHVHHKNGIPWDNRKENFLLVTNEEHQRIHKKFDESQRLRVAMLYENESNSSYDVVDSVDFDISPSTVVKIHREVFGDDK
jgi:hypothetical protein